MTRETNARTSAGDPRQLTDADVLTLRFADDGFVPNHPHWPLLLYRNAVVASSAEEAARLFESLYGRNGWGRSWRNGVYPWTHYHSGVHEVLGVACGTGEVQFGGDGGEAVTLRAGDVAILPAGTGHKRLSASDDFLVIGAYPPEGVYDECTKPEDHEHAVRAIAGVPRPQTDPIYGASGPLVARWSD